MNNDVMFSSNTDMWETPKDLFDRLNSIYHFTCDVCATAENAKCEKYYSPKENGLLQTWDGCCWCNPPYGREIGKWVEKAFNSNCKVVMLLPARTDTRWFHNYCKKGTIEFLQGRLKFGKAKNNAPFPCMIVIFDNRKEIELNLDIESAKILKDVCLDVMDPTHLITWLDDEQFDVVNSICELLEYKLERGD